jgi:hypothetical protein
MRGSRPGWRHGGLGIALVLALGGPGGCSSSKVEPIGGGAGTDAGEPCQQAGQTLTGCSCKPGQPPGLRHCEKNLIWTACMCPPAQPASKCAQGQDVLCNLCPGESVGRMTKCLQDGTFDCACPASSGAGHDMDGG